MKSLIMSLLFIVSIYFIIYMMFFLGTSYAYHEEILSEHNRKSLTVADRHAIHGMLAELNDPGEDFLTELCQRRPEQCR